MQYFVYADTPRNPIKEVTKIISVVCKMADASARTVVSLFVSRATPASEDLLACVAGGIGRGRGKVLVYERRSREENGERTAIKIPPATQVKDLLNN